MILFISKKKHKIFALIFILVFTLFVFIINSWYADVKGVYSSTLTQKIITKSYSILLPESWKVKNSPSIFHLNFYINNIKVGWMITLGYIAYGNGWEIIETRQLEGYRYEVQMTLLWRQKPAASNDPTLRKEIHFYIMDSSTRVYDLAFYSDYVDENTAKEIVKSFIIK